MLPVTTSEFKLSYASWHIVFKDHKSGFACFSPSLSVFPAALHSLYLLCFHRYGHDAKVVHFLGKVKPWNHSYDAQRGEVKGHSLSPDLCQLHPNYLLMWWQLYSKSVLPLLQQAYGETPFCSGFVEASEDVCQRSCMFWNINEDGCDCVWLCV